ncbi:MAG: hypothetical protein MPK62_13765, partial [Alphaproteobacteria bacterium]|nr:hypothetical protein [Alphaproteobacteria bacterium]
MVAPAGTVTVSVEREAPSADNAQSKVRGAPCGRLSTTDAGPGAKLSASVRANCGVISTSESMRPVSYTHL